MGSSGAERALVADGSVGLFGVDGVTELGSFVEHLDAGPSGCVVGVAARHVELVLACREVPGEGLAIDQDGVSDAAVRAALVGEDADGLVDAGLVESLVEVLGFGQRVAAADEAARTPSLRSWPCPTQIP